MLRSFALSIAGRQKTAARQTKSARSPYAVADPNSQSCVTDFIHVRGYLDWWLLHTEYRDGILVLCSDYLILVSYQFYSLIHDSLSESH